MRLFTGISLDNSVGERVRAALDQLRTAARVKWTPAENLHVTLKFIGPWPDERLAELRAALDGMTEPPRFSMDVSRFGFFPNPHHPHSFFAGVHGGDALAGLARAIDEALAKIGCPREERPYTPHLTLARIKRGDEIGKLRERIAGMTNNEFGSFVVKDFHLYQSKPAGAGSVYSVLATYPLADAA